MSLSAKILIAVVGTWTAGAMVLPAAVAEGGHGNFASRKVRVGEETREYRLFAPKSVDLTVPAPLVVAFHGMGIDSKDLMPWYTGLNQTAEKHKVLIAYPSAVGRTWGIDPKKVVSDLAFFDALVEQVGGDYQIDARRIYVLGMSNGGYFAHLAAKERSTRIAAAASHSGPLGLQTLLGIKAERKFPVLIIHGDRDKLMPVEWARENRDKYRREGHEVQYVEVPGLGHAWAAKENINETIWKFFEEHPLAKK